MGTTAMGVVGTSRLSQQHRRHRQRTDADRDRRQRPSTVAGQPSTGRRRGDRGHHGDEQHGQPPGLQHSGDHQADHAELKGGSGGRDEIVAGVAEASEPVHHRCQTGERGDQDGESDVRGRIVHLDQGGGQHAAQSTASCAETSIAAGVTGGPN